MNIAQRLTELGITLPQPPAPVAAYVPFVLSGQQIHISGQLPVENGKVSVTGHLGVDVDIATGQKAAYLCAINILAQLHRACDGHWDRIERCVKLGVYIASAPHFINQPEVANGASELIEKVLGENGKHARSAVGVAVLPRQAAVEIDAIFSMK